MFGIGFRAMTVMHVQTNSASPSEIRYGEIRLKFETIIIK